MPTETTAALDQIFISPLNPRKTYDQAALAELAASISQKGVLQPGLARKSTGPKPFELIFGTRRLKASELAGLTTMPIRVVDMTDQEVVEAAVIENGQRQDIHPLEEAEGYERLAHPPKGATYKALSVDEIAAKVNKSKSWVYSRMKLLELTAANRKRFYAGAIDASRALLLSRIPKTLQDKAGEEIEDNDEGEWSYRHAHEHVVRNYMLRMADAPFDLKDATLVAKAGGCDKCPKRTGNQGELFADVGSADLCTDPDCFKAKKHALADKQLAEAKAKKQEVLPQAEVKKLFYRDDGGLRWDSKFVEAPKDADPDKVVLAKTGDGDVHRLMRKPKDKQQSYVHSYKPKQPSAGALISTRVEARTREELAKLIATKPSAELWRAIATAAAHAATWGSKEIERRKIGADKMKPGSTGFSPTAAAPKIIKELKSVGDLQAFVVGIVLDRVDFNSMKPLMKAAGVDIEAHVTRATTEIKPGKKKPKAKDPQKSKNGKAGAAVLAAAKGAVIQGKPVKPEFAAKGARA